MSRTPPFANDPIAPPKKPNIVLYWMIAALVLATILVAWIVLHPGG